MKIKKIELSAFRIFNKPENAIFDFSTKSAEIADFISLYAPNGFGKTSFYDAVEWGVTGSINRFFIRNKELEKLANNQFSQNDIPLLRNSKLERDTYVKVFTDSIEKPFENVILKNSNKPDLPLKKNADPHDFHKVILSQEWISAFLTEKDGEERYKKFMENPELSEVNNYYLNLKHLLAVQKTEEDQLKQDIKLLQEKIKDIEDENLLETINKQIHKLIQVYGENDLQSIQIGTTNNELIKLKDLIAKKIIYFNNNKDSYTKTIDQIRIAKTGNDKLLGLNAFGDSKTSLASLIKQKEEVVQLLKKFEEYEKLTNKLNSNHLKLKELSLKKEALEIPLSKLSQYDNVKNSIKSKIDLHVEIEKELSALTEGIEKLKRDEISLNEQLKTCLRQIETNEEKKGLLPSLQKNIDDTNLALSEIEKSILEHNPKIETIEKEIKNLQNQIKVYETSIIQIQDAKYSITDFEEKTELFELISELNRNHSDLADERKKLVLLNNKFEQQQVLNSTIQSFIEQGLAIVIKSKSSNCPLCEQPYSDFSALAKQISGNKTLSEALQELFKQKQNLSEHIAKLEETIKTGNKSIIDFYTHKINSLNFEILERTESIVSIEKIITAATDKIKYLRTKRTEIALSMTGMSYVIYEKHLIDTTTLLTELKTKLTNKFSQCVGDLKEKNEEKEKVKSQISLLNQEKEEFSKNIDYVAVIEYFKENYPTENISMVILEKSFENIMLNIININDDIKKLENLLSPLNTELSGYNKESLKSQELEFEQKKISLEQDLNTYRLFLKENFEINANGLDVNQILKTIGDKDSKYKGESEKCRQIHDEYITFEKNSEHIIDFLQTEKTKLSIKAKKEELSFLETSVRTAIENERKIAKEYLAERIKDFFFEDLINKLYAKIDPHPDFKMVNFIPNLDIDPPRLDVFVKNGNLETLIPNLYFSTAQINILSLCIFLASALQSKEYDCILIDDPIQSMDSINVLSTIDLLRSIMVNNGKQIILSTHDENFHKLLKKKIPPELFKSKFLRLETFGKVIEDVEKN